MHDEAAAEAFQDGWQVAAALRDDAAGEQGGFLERERVVGVARELERRERVEFAVDVHVAAVEDDFHVVDSFQADFDGALSVEEDGRVEDGAAVFVAVRRRVAPAAAPVDAERQLDDVAFLRDAAGLVVFKVVQRAVEDELLDGAEAFRRLAVSRDAVQSHADVVVEAHGVAEIRRLEMLFKPCRLDGRQGRLLEEAFDFAGGAFGADGLRDAVHADEFAHAARPVDDGLRIGVVEA